MITAFWLVVALVGLLLFINVRDIARRYNIDQSRAKAVVFLGPLLIMGYLMVHIAFRIIDLAGDADDQDQESGQGLSHPAHKSIFRHSLHTGQKKYTFELSETPADQQP